MAPKVKITKEDIIKAALKILGRCGEDSVNSRSIAAQLGCSTQPVFSNFESMEDLIQEMREMAFDMYNRRLENARNTGKYPAYKAMGMEYIRFAREEKELFKFLFMCDRSNESATRTDDFEDAVKIISSSLGIPTDIARIIHLEVWTSVHGIATMLATSFLELDEELISNMLSDVYLGIKGRHEKGDHIRNGNKD